MNCAAESACEPGPLRQALLLIGAGALLGVLSDLCLPAGAIENRALVLRDLEAQVPVKLYTPEEAVRLHLEGEALLLDARPNEATRQSHALDAITCSLELIDRYQDKLIPLLIGREVLVVLEAERSEEARELAARLVSGFSAARAGTVEGGWEALQSREELLLVEGDASAGSLDGQSGERP